MVINGFCLHYKVSALAHTSGFVQKSGCIVYKWGTNKRHIYGEQKLSCSCSSSFSFALYVRRCNLQNLEMHLWRYSPTSFKTCLCADISSSVCSFKLRMEQESRLFERKFHLLFFRKKTSVRFGADLSISSIGSCMGRSPITSECLKRWTVLSQSLRFLLKTISYRIITAALRSAFCWVCGKNCIRPMVNLSHTGKNSSMELGVI